MKVKVVLGQGPGFYSYDRMINLLDTIISESYVINHADARLSLVFS